MSPRLPLASPEDLRHELDMIAWERERLDGRVISPARRAERQAGLAVWETDLREQLAEAEAAA